MISIAFIYTPLSCATKYHIFEGIRSGNEHSLFAALDGILFIGVGEGEDGEDIQLHVGYYMSPNQKESSFGISLFLIPTPTIYSDVTL